MDNADDDQAETANERQRTISVDEHVVDHEQIMWSDHEGKDDNSDSEQLEEDESDLELEKDEAELELERAVFGEATGFRNELKEFQLRRHENLQTHDDEDLDQDLSAVDNADLFYVDVTPDIATKHQVDKRSYDQRVVERSRGPPAWHDSDDEHRNISLSSVPRLRKLRHYEGEDIVSEVEYQRRLRQQFELLHPVPEWSLWNSTRPTKRRRRSWDQDVSSNGEDNTSESETESTQPLVHLLRSAHPLTRFNDTAQIAHSEGSRERNVLRLPKLHPNTLSIYRHPPIQNPSTQPHAITCLSFHPKLPLILSSGLSGTCFLHHLDPHPIPPDPQNPLLTSLRLKGVPLTTAIFSTTNSDSKDNPIDTQIYLSSLRHRYFHKWDLNTGKISKTTRLTAAKDPHSDIKKLSKSPFSILRPSPNGQFVACLPSSSVSSKNKEASSIYILNSKSSQLIAIVAPSNVSRVADAQWWNNSYGLCIALQNGEMMEYSMSLQKVVRRWCDEGGLGITVIALGGPPIPDPTVKGSTESIGSDTMTAIGSRSGLVSLFSRLNLRQSSKSSDSRLIPIRVLENLTTPISHLEFAPEVSGGQLLVMSSRWKRDALRLVFLGNDAASSDIQPGRANVEVLKQWPTSKTPFGRVSSVAWGIMPSQVQNDVKSSVDSELLLAVGNEAGTLRYWGVGVGR